MSIQFFIAGHPAPQGRPKFARRGKFVTVYDPPKSKAWKEVVALQAQAAGVKPLEGPLKISLTFRIKRPKKPANPYPVGDVDNYCKGTKDALNKLAYKDDAQIVELHATKEYVSEGFVPGVMIKIEEVIL
jgi:Holliday junction resolvase RusA-like endonuclease